MPPTEPKPHRATGRAQISDLETVQDYFNGACERCGTPVVQKDLEQWFFRITDYADRLLDDLETIQWPPHVVRMQQNWIGRSAGARVTFAVDGDAGTTIDVFTTRIDTISYSLDNHFDLQIYGEGTAGGLMNPDVIIAWIRATYMDTPFLRAAFQPGGQRGYIVGYLLRRRPGCGFSGKRASGCARSGPASARC